MRRLLSAVVALAVLAGADLTGAEKARAAELLDATPRTAVVTAFPPELPELLAAVSDQKAYEAAGVSFVTGVMEGRPVVLFMSGVSMVNAAMSTQALLDRFKIERIVFSGVAGGVDPGLDIGDVVAPDRWGQYQESYFAREVGGKLTPPDGHTEDTPTGNFGMSFPQSVVIAHGARPQERRFWFPVDPGLMAIAKAMPTPALRRCVAEVCLVKPPRMVIGGNGVSGPTFVDNAAYRQYAFDTFQARVLDMETAAVAHVAYANGGVPFIAFRSLSDLAGGGEGENQARTFYALAGGNSAMVVRSFLKALPK